MMVLYSVDITVAPDREVVIETTWVNVLAGWIDVSVR
jgi:hypothetical protein